VRSRRGALPQLLPLVRSICLVGATATLAAAAAAAEADAVASQVPSAHARISFERGTFPGDEKVGLLGTSSLVMGLPLTAVQLVVTLWVVSRLHRHRAPAEEPAADDEERPAA